MRTNKSFRMKASWTEDYIDPTTYKNFPFDDELAETRPQPKKFNVLPISDEENEFRKSILRELRDVHFKHSRSKLSFSMSFFDKYKLPKNSIIHDVNQNPTELQEKLAILIRLEPGGFIGDKCNYDLNFMILNNEAELKHKQTGVHVQDVKGGERLIVPANKRFYLVNNDVDVTHLLLLLEPSASYPQFL